MNIIIYVDLDETLVRTSEISSAARLFDFGAQGEVTRRLAEIDAYHSLIKRYQAGETSPLIELAKALGVVFLPPADKGIYVSRLRPYALEFLQKIRQLGFPVNLLTAGDKNFQSSVVELLNIKSYLDQILARQDISRALIDKPLVPADYIPLLIDDLPISSYGFTNKFMALGVLPPESSKWSQHQDEDKVAHDIADKHYIQVQPYLGGSQDQELFKILPLVSAKIQTLLD